MAEGLKYAKYSRLKEIHDFRSGRNNYFNVLNILEKKMWPWDNILSHHTASKQ
jgi:hypothetical protein